MWSNILRNNEQSSQQQTIDQLFAFQKGRTCKNIRNKEIKTLKPA